MRRTAATFAVLIVLPFALALARISAQTRPPSAAYFPERFGWEHRTPAQMGMNPSLVDEAAKTAMQKKSAGRRGMKRSVGGSSAREPFDTPIGPYKDRGPASGVLLRR